MIFPFIIAAPQLNIHSLQHDCLRTISYLEQEHLNIYEIVSYCLNEILTNSPTNNTMTSPKFSFLQLSQQNVTSQDLYRWSAPIDLIEDYQFYLNQQLLSVEEKFFYNCTLPRFGSLCQYELISYHQDFSSLKDIIHHFFGNFDYDSITTFTCYIDLQCYRGPSPVCLQWTEICDGKIDCLDGGFDEIHCWQLEINECMDNEYRCYNGQCISNDFYQDFTDIPDCLDGTDEVLSHSDYQSFCVFDDEPSFECEDVSYITVPILNYRMAVHSLLLMEAMYSIENSTLSKDCLSAFKYVPYSTILEDQYIDIIQNQCPEMFYFPNIPILFGDIYFAYKRNDFQYDTTVQTTPFYICCNPSFYEKYFSNYASIIFKNTLCIHSEAIISEFLFQSPSLAHLHRLTINELYARFSKHHLIFNYTIDICNRSSMYPCMNSSKCISIYRQMNIYTDCPYMDDEDINNLNKNIHRDPFKCPVYGEYIHPMFVEDGKCDCRGVDSNCEDEFPHIAYLKTSLNFQHICDGFTDRLPELINNRNETDETECDQWNCNNTYTRCNGVWNCLNGADEAGCPSCVKLQCSSTEHLCVQPDTYQLTCLPLEEAYNGKIDCLGATDEPQMCGSRQQKVVSYTHFYEQFYCKNHTDNPCISPNSLCDNVIDCNQEDDERFCTNETINKRLFPLQYQKNYSETNVETFLFRYTVPERLWKIIYFILDEPVESYYVNQKETIETRSSSTIQKSIESTDNYCHRGLVVRFWSNVLICLCPSSYYGSQCQYQNQRVSLTIKFRALASSRQILFAIIIMLIDDSEQQIVQSYEQLTYLSASDCQTKFNIYLLYSTRPKDISTNYSIRIDIYEKVSREYRGSLIYPIEFSFLPVYRLSVIADIPRKYDSTRICSIDRCDHGRCTYYSNNLQSDNFCKCDPGWSGRYCHIRYTCNCSIDSLCIDISANNRSICLCPIDKFGPRCVLLDTICQTNENTNSTCQNGGQCVPINDYVESKQKLICICQQGFRGERCEIIDDRITLSFDKNIITSQSLSIHFIEVINIETEPFRSTTFRTLPVKQDSVVIYWSRPFHLVFIEFDNKDYYLALVQKIYNQSTPVNATITSSDHCPHISQILNETIIQLHPLRRIKYYHLPCQIYAPNLKCFYDEIHLCLCYNFANTRLANCLQFNHNESVDCWQQSECEHDGRCYQDRKTCPQKSICICPPCFYGVRCQFSTRDFGLSLDTILGYHIYPYLDFSEQPIITQMSLGLTIIFVVIGLINSISCIITFQNATLREVGCGMYLLGSSITTLLITIMFGLKYFIFLLIQMTIITNQSFVLFQCYSLDFILRICLSMVQWLTACVAIERAISVIMKTTFNKKKSKTAAKYVICILFIIITGTCIHDPLHRRIVEEENNDDIRNNQKRFWCIVSYSSNVEFYNYIIHSIHFFGPFLVNICSAIIFVSKQARLKFRLHTDRAYEEHLLEQYREYRHLLISPIVLVLLALPRLIIIFVSKCMQSANDAWLFLIGYFIAFLPPMLTFIVFVSPSKFYKDEFYKSIRQFQTRIRRA